MTILLIVSVIHLFFKLSNWLCSWSKHQWKYNHIFGGPILHAWFSKPHFFFSWTLKKYLNMFLRVFTSFSWETKIWILFYILVLRTSQQINCDANYNFLSFNDFNIYCELKQGYIHGPLYFSLLKLNLLLTALETFNLYLVNWKKTEMPRLLVLEGLSTSTSSSKAFVPLWSLVYIYLGDLLDDVRGRLICCSFLLTLR
jgi:hypothetical protein